MLRQIQLALLLGAMLLGGSLLAAVARGGQAQTDGVPRITLAEFKSLLASADPPFVIDVRSGIQTKIKGAHNIPLGDIEARLSEIPRDRAIITYCS